jgi:hypothetical protein
MIPPLPSPPMIALVAFILLTTFTSPTAAALYSPPAFSVTSLNALVDDRLDTELPGVFFNIPVYFLICNLLQQPMYTPRQTYFRLH